MASNSEIKQPSAPMHRQTDERLSLSPEEQILINKLKTEAALYRGYPLALATATLTTVMLRRNFPQMPKWRNIGLSLLGGISGNILGKITYAPEMIRRLESELPDDSKLKKQIMDRRKMAEGQMMDGGFPLNMQTDTSSSSDASSSYDQASAYGQDSSNSVYESSPATPAPAVESPLQDSKYVTYEELRKKHRQSLDWKTHPKVEESPPAVQDSYDPSPMSSGSGEDAFPSRLSRPRDPPVRYNKYGDPILEP